MSKTFKSIWNVATSIVIAAVVILALLLAGPRLLGFQVFTVLSGSMEPVYHTGSLIYVKDIEDTRAVPDGTVITFMASEDTIVTHRIVAAVPDEDDPSLIRYRTKGDANDVEDGTLVHYKNILGTPVFTVPKLGYVANYIQNPPGSYMTICFGAIFILLLFLPELLAVFIEQEEEEKPPKEKKPKKEKRPRKEKRAEKNAPAKAQYTEDFPYEEPVQFRERVSYEEPEYEAEAAAYEEAPWIDDFADVPWADDAYYEEPQPKAVRETHAKSKRRGGAHVANRR